MVCYILWLSFYVLDIVNGSRKSGSEMKLIIVLYIATSLVVGKPVEENSNTKGMSKMLFFMTKIYLI